MNKIFIVGLGLIGGSIAKKLKKDFKDRYTIYALSENQTDIDNAINENVIDKGYISLSSEDMFDFDIVILATMPNDIITMINELKSHFNKDIIFTDVASVKSDILEKVKSLDINFVGGHPMTGTEKRGYENSFAHLFENAYYILTNKSEKVHNLVFDLGATPIYLDGSIHDKAVGVISHIPHIISATLVHLAINSETNDKLLMKIAAGGFRDTTRISSSNEELWRDVLLLNRENILKLIDEFSNLLQQLRTNLFDYDDESIYNYFKEARIFREELQENRTEIQSEYFDIYISVEDRIGVINDISNILTKNSINIKNIGVLKSRENIGGTIILSVYTKDDYITSKQLLKENNFEVLKKQ